MKFKTRLKQRGYVKMPSEYKTYSLNIASVESLKETMRKNDISFRGDADAIHKAIDKYITDFKLNTMKESS